jgi:hypothetical protein
MVLEGSSSDLFQDVIHNHPPYFAFPDLLVAVFETSTGCGGGGGLVKWITRSLEDNHFTNLTVFSTATSYEVDPTKNGPTKTASKDDSSPHVDEPTEDTTNKAVTIAHSTPRIYSYTPPVAPHPVYIATHLPKHCKTRSRSPNSWCPHCSVWVFSNILVSTWWWPTQKRAETCSCFLQQFENTVVLRLTFTHLISTIIESHNEDDAGWCGMMPPKILHC